MKSIKLLVCIISAVLLPALSQAQENDFSAFLGKLKVYVENHSYDWTMPAIKPDTTVPAPMPAPDMEGFKEDPVTGLRFFPRSGNIYDPETGYAFNTRTGKISREKSPDI